MDVIKAILIFLLGFAMAVGFAIFLNPTPTWGNERALSVTSLTETYKAQIEAIDFEIATSTEALADLKYRPLTAEEEQTRRGNIEWVSPANMVIFTEKITLGARINQLNKDRHTLEITYKLIEESLK